MDISLNYRFLLRIAVTMAVSTGLLGLLLMRGFDHHRVLVPLWGHRSMATDLTTFSFIFGFFLSWAVTKLTRQAMKAKKVLPLHWHLKSQTLIDRLPANTLHRALMLGLSGVVLAGIMLLMFQFRHIEQLPYHQYLVLFVMHAVSMAAVITAMAVYRALGDKVARHSAVKQRNTPTF